jgi:hypothetical protein
LLDVLCIFGQGMRDGCGDHLPRHFEPETPLLFSEIRAENYRGFRFITPRQKITGGIVVYFGFAVSTECGCCKSQ